MIRMRVVKPMYGRRHPMNKYVGKIISVERNGYRGNQPMYRQLNCTENNGRGWNWFAWCLKPATKFTNEEEV